MNEIPAGLKCIKLRGKAWSATGRSNADEQRMARRSHVCHPCGAARRVIGYWAGKARDCSACGTSVELGAVTGGWGDLEMSKGGTSR